MFAHRDRNHDLGGLASVLPGIAPALAQSAASKNCDNTRLWHDLAEESGRTRHDIDLQTCEIRMDVRGQTDIIKDQINRTIDNQTRLAWDAERMQNQRWESELRDRLAERDRIILERNAQLLQQETINNTNAKFCALQNELTNIRDQMLKAPQYIPFGGVAASNPCVPSPIFT